MSFHLLMNPPKRLLNSSPNLGVQETWRIPLNGNVIYRQVGKKLSEKSVNKQEKTVIKCLGECVILSHVAQASFAKLLNDVKEWRKEIKAMRENLLAMSRLGFSIFTGIEWDVLGF